jgi:hypothetical protein
MLSSPVLADYASSPVLVNSFLACTGELCFLSCTELEFLKSLRGVGTEEE